MKRNTSFTSPKMGNRRCAIVAAMPLLLVLASLANAEYTFSDQTPTAPILAGDYQRYVTLLGDGTNLALWYENRTQGTIEMRTSAAGYTGFGSAQTTTGLSGLSHPRVFSDGGTGYLGYFWDSAQSPPNGVKRLTSTDGLSWSSAAQITIANSPFPSSKIWGVQGCFENLSGDTDVLYYTEGTGANEQLYRATATDGVNFTHQGTAFVNPCSPGLGIGVGAGSQVCYDPGESQYLLVWCGESVTDNIAYATSADGLSFTQQGSVILENSGHDDLEEVSFVLNGSELVGLYTADFAGDSNNHIGAFTGSASAVIPEPATVVVWLLGGAVLLCCAAGRKWRRRGR